MSGALPLGCGWAKHWHGEVKALMNSTVFVRRMEVKYDVFYGTMLGLMLTKLIKGFWMRGLALGKYSLDDFVRDCSDLGFLDQAM